MKKSAVPVLALTRRGFRVRYPLRPNSLIRLLSLLVISSMMYATLAGITWCPAAAALYFQTVCPVACATMLVTGMGLCWTPRSPSVAAPSARSSSVMPHVRDPSVAAHWVGDGQLTCVLPLMTQFWLSEVTPMASSVFAMYCVPVAYSVLTAGMLNEFPRHSLRSQVPWTRRSSSNGEYGAAPGIGNLYEASRIGVVIVNLVDAMAAVYVNSFVVEPMFSWTAAASFTCPKYGSA